MSSNIHASCVVYKQRGILITGASGSGKSDLCLRLIMAFGAELVADDRVNLRLEKQQIIASAPTILQGLLEVRGLGIINRPFATEAALALAVELVNKPEEIVRLPEPETFEFCEAKIKKIKLFAPEASAPAKILAALSLL